jgi:hypothetical protein
MRELFNDKRNLLRYYSERDRTISTHDRTPAHRHLLRIGYIEEQALATQHLLIRVTEAGRRTLWSPP